MNEKSFHSEKVSVRECMALLHGARELYWQNSDAGILLLSTQGASFFYLGLGAS